VEFPPPTPEYCTRHPDEVTGRHCTRCDRPACGLCLVQASVGSQCIDCVRSSQPPLATRVRRWNATQSDIATRTLIAINLAVFVWVILGGSSGVISGSTFNMRQYNLALREDFLADGEWYRLITAGFLHFGFFHILMNMILLFQLGRILEPGLGARRFVLLYFAALLGGSVGSIIVSPESLAGGASGAVFGLMAAASVALHQRGINPFQTGIGAILLLNLLITFTIPGISIGGHIGGALVGGAVGYCMLQPRWQKTMPWISWVSPIAAIIASCAFVYAIV
jgi:membrane associated rhomboid family serine protease